MKANSKRVQEKKAYFDAVEREAAKKRMLEALTPEERDQYIQKESERQARAGRVVSQLMGLSAALHGDPYK